MRLRRWRGCRTPIIAGESEAKKVLPNSKLAGNPQVEWLSEHISAHVDVEEKGNTYYSRNQRRAPITDER
jgi:hypothetical protein